MQVIDFHDLIHDRIWRAVLAPDLTALVEGIEPPTPEYVLLICADTVAIPGPQLAAIADKLLATGAGYVCCWGPDCERLHDCFDEASQYRGTRGAGVIMTTWHNNESLEEAAWFATHSAYPEEHYEAAFGSVVVAVTGPTDWFRAITEYLGRGAPLLDEA